MPRSPHKSSKRLPLRVHDFLASLRLHDVWAVDLQAASAVTAIRVGACCTTS